jgi:hypothetical protein
MRRELGNVIGSLESDKDLPWEVRQRGKESFLRTKGAHNKTKPQTNSMSFCGENKLRVPGFCSIHTRNEPVTSATVPKQSS